MTELKTFLTTLEQQVSTQTAQLQGAMVILNHLKEWVSGQEQRNKTEGQASEEAAAADEQPPVDRGTAPSAGYFAGGRV